MSGVSNVWQKLRTDINAQGVIKQTLQDQFNQKWFIDTDNSSKGRLYRFFKETFGFENYIDRLFPKFKNTSLKFRRTNHRLPVEVGR
jgi:gamma-glutamylcysteine synthetase